MADQKATATMEKGEIGKGFAWGAGFLAVGFIAAKVLGRNDAPQAQLGHRRGAARVRGAIQGIRTARLNADLSKVVGQPVTVAVFWIAATQDFQGNDIDWPYQLRLNLFDVATNQSLIQICDLTNCGTTVRTPGGKNITLQIPTTGLPAGRYGVNLALAAAVSDANGQPTAQLVNVASKNAPDFVVIAPASGPAVPGGGLGTVTLSQRRGRQ